jgi:hypothetical protein
VHGVNVTVPFDNVYVPTFGTSTDMDAQLGAFVPEAHNRVEFAIRVTPFGTMSFARRSTLCVAPTTSKLVFAIAADAPGGVTVGVIVEDAY